MISFCPLPDCFTEWLVRALRQQRLHFLKCVHRQTLQQSFVGLRGKGHSSTPRSLQPEITQAKYLQAWLSVLHKQLCLYFALSHHAHAALHWQLLRIQTFVWRNQYFVQTNSWNLLSSNWASNLGSVLTSRPVLFSLQCLCPEPLTYWKCSWQKLSLTSAGAQIFIGTAGAKRASAINKSPHPLMPCYLYQEVCFNLLSAGQLEKVQQENTASSFSAMLAGSWKPGLSYTWHVLHLGQPEATCRGWVTGWASKRSTEPMKKK